MLLLIFLASWWSFSSLSRFFKKTFYCWDCHCEYFELSCISLKYYCRSYNFLRANSSFLVLTLLKYLFSFLTIWAIDLFLSSISCLITFAFSSSCLMRFILAYALFNSAFLLSYIFLWFSSFLSWFWSIPIALTLASSILFLAISSSFSRVLILFLIFCTSRDFSILIFLASEVEVK